MLLFFVKNLQFQLINLGPSGHLLLHLVSQKRFFLQERLFISFHFRPDLFLVLPPLRLYGISVRERVPVESVLKPVCLLFFSLFLVNVSNLCVDHLDMLKFVELDLFNLFVVKKHLAIHFFESQPLTHDAIDFVIELSIVLL